MLDMGHKNMNDLQWASKCWGGLAIPYQRVHCGITFPDPAGSGTLKVQEPETSSVH
jgi:hypothetical protein